MTIPTTPALLTPFLKLCGDKKEHSRQDTTEYLARLFRLSDDDRRLLLPSGKSPLFYNRVAWAQARLRRSGLIESVRRGTFKITERGLEALSRNVTIDEAFLEQFPEYLEFIGKKTGGVKNGVYREKSIDASSSLLSLSPSPSTSLSSSSSPLDQDKTPDEIIDDTYEAITKTLVNDVLEKVKGCTPAFFERMVLELLVKMGYGGRSIKETAEVVGRSGDGGIDGIIKEDILGLDVIYVQAKKWDSVVGRPEIHKFWGALEGQKARRGIFITTGRFSREAVDFASGVKTVVLIDGDRLAQLMVEHNIGVATDRTIELKKIDSDYFDVDI
jgi:restriction system protein